MSQIRGKKLRKTPSVVPEGDEDAGDDAKAPAAPAPAAGPKRNPPRAVKKGGAGVDPMAELKKRVASRRQVIATEGEISVKKDDKEWEV